MNYIAHDFKIYIAAERARAEFPELDWLHLTGLIHDMGKVMAFYDEPQWAVVGDTFPVGCEPSENIVFRNETFQNNPDLKNPKYNTKYGMYEKNCGIQKLLMSWGHDEYLYHFLLHNKSTLPEEAQQIIRYHSFYPWHTSGDYSHFEVESDERIKKWVNVFKCVSFSKLFPNSVSSNRSTYYFDNFSRYDLYTKSTIAPDIEALWPYYQSLIDKYLPGNLDF